ncbi:hypothetical protein H0H87_005978, partial [Tephrocybe sp. NHM501043]
MAVMELALSVSDIYVADFQNRVEAYASTIIGKDAHCPTAFHKPEDNQVQVACQQND